MWDNAQISPGHTTSLMLAFRVPRQLVQPAAARGAQVARGRFRQARRIDGQDTGGITQRRVHDERGNSVTQGCIARGAGGWLRSAAAGLIFRVIQRKAQAQPVLRRPTLQPPAQTLPLRRRSRKCHRPACNTRPSQRASKSAACARISSPSRMPASWLRVRSAPKAGASCG